MLRLERDRPVAECEQTSAKLDPSIPLHRALMVVMRMRSAWDIDATTTDGYERLARLREEVDYLTAEQTPNPPGIPHTELPLSAFVYDESSVVHRTSHPDRPDDDVGSLQPRLIKEVSSLLEISPRAIKLLASNDSLFAEQ